MAVAALAATATAMKTAGGVMNAVGQSEAQLVQKRRAQRAATVARLQATQTDTAYRDELLTTLGNIDAIRASVNMSPSSPTAFALSDKAREDSDAQRQRKVAGLHSQASQYDDDARFYGQAARSYLLSGLVGTAGRTLGSIGQMTAPSGGGGGGGNG